jgi:hypothetical protein
MTRSGLASNGYQHDLDASYGDTVGESTEGMAKAQTRLARLRREGFGIGKTCAEMPSDIICPTGFSVVDVLSDWGVNLERPNKKQHSLFFRIAGYPNSWQKADDPDETSVVRYHILDDQGRIRLTSLFERKRRCEDGVIRPDTRSKILLELHARFSITTRVEGTRVVASAWDANAPDKAIHQLSRAFNHNADRRTRLAVPRKAREAMEVWLDERYPDWRDPRAYWDNA